METSFRVLYMCHRHSNEWCPVSSVKISSPSSCTFVLTGHHPVEGTPKLGVGPRERNYELLLNSLCWIVSISLCFQRLDLKHMFTYFYSRLCLWMYVVCRLQYRHLPDVIFFSPPSGHRHLQMFSSLQRPTIPYSIQHRGWRYDPWKQSSSQVRLQTETDTQLNKRKGVHKARWLSLRDLRSIFNVCLGSGSALNMFWWL